MTRESRRMRWLHADPNLAVERQYIETTVGRIDAWWREFASKTHDLDALPRGKTQWDLPAWMHEHLQAIHPELPVAR